MKLTSKVHCIYYYYLPLPAVYKSFQFPIRKVFPFQSSHWEREKKEHFSHIFCFVCATVFIRLVDTFVFVCLLSFLHQERTKINGNQNWIDENTIFLFSLLGALLHFSLVVAVYLSYILNAPGDGVICPSFLRDSSHRLSLLSTILRTNITIIIIIKCRHAAGSISRIPSGMCKKGLVIVKLLGIGGPCNIHLQLRAQVSTRSWMFKLLETIAKCRKTIAPRELITRG